MHDQIAQILRTARARDGQLNIDLAVNAIFALPGKKFAFLFNQNARRTNLQIGELLALTRQHLYNNLTQRHQTELEFLTFDEIKTFLGELLEHGRIGNETLFVRFCEEVSQYLSDKVLIEAYYGTAYVFLPPHFSLDIALVCGESGYIHSCGDLLLLRNAEKVTETLFKDAVRECVNNYHTDEDGFLFVPYCHEDFSHLDRDSTPFLQYGLDDVKLNISKAFVGSTRLYDLLYQIDDEFSEKVVLAPAGDFKKSTEVFRERFSGKNLKTIFLLSDSNLVKGSRFPGSRKFYIMYVQRFKNNNVYHLYDENKPGWASHTTLPHSLTGAMISIARPWFKNEDNIEIADPFGGSGTVFFETQKIPGLNCRSSDRAAIFSETIIDNTEFFALNIPELEAIRSGLEVFKTTIPDPNWDDAPKKRKETPEQQLVRISAVVRSWAKQSAGDFLRLSAEELESGFSSLSKNNRLDRLLAYLGLRASVRGTSDIERGTASWHTFFRRELSDFLKQIDNQIGWMKLSGGNHPKNSQLLFAHSVYSPATIPRPAEIGRYDLLGKLDFIQDTIENLPPGRYDAIITDPPYGFNTDENYWEMADFVRKMIESLVRGLKPGGGQLILAAPQVSFSGKGIMPFVRADFLAREVVRTCGRLNKECVKPAVVTPRFLAHVQPPYYWVAEKSLERKILHFWIRDQV